MSPDSMSQRSFAPKKGCKCFNASRAMPWVFFATVGSQVSSHRFAAISNVGGSTRFFTPPIRSTSSCRRLRSASRANVFDFDRVDSWMMRPAVKGVRSGASRTCALVGTHTADESALGRDEMVAHCGCVFPVSAKPSSHFKCPPDCAAQRLWQSTHSFPQNDHLGGKFLA